MRRFTLPLSFAALAVALAAGCSGSSDGAAAASSEPGTVVVKNLRYAPKTVTVDAGDTVTWQFDDGRIPHDVKGKGFASPRRTSGAWSRVFATPGSYDYHCTLHPYMKGTVEVR